MESGLRAELPCDETSDSPACELCGSLENLKLCVRCRAVWYCCKEHQVTDWKRHKKRCGKDSKPEDPVGSLSGSGLFDVHSQKSVSECDSARTKSFLTDESKSLEAEEKEGNATSNVLDCDEELSKLHLDPGAEDNTEETGNAMLTEPAESGGAYPMQSSAERSTRKGSYKCNKKRSGRKQEQGRSGASGGTKPKQSSMNTSKPKGSNRYNRRTGRKQEPQMPGRDSTESASERKAPLGDYLVKSLTDYGLCVIDNFLGEEICEKILQEVKLMQDKDELNDGELINKHEPVRKVRGDKIAWTEKGDAGHDYISVLIQKLDNLIMSCSRRFGRYVIGGRTKVSEKNIMFLN